MFDKDNIEMKVVSIFLIAFTILLGFQALQFMNVRRIDRKHTELMVIKNRSLEAVQNLLVQSSTIQRKLLNLALTENPSERKELLSIISDAARKNDQYLVDLETTAAQLDPGEGTYIQELKDASAEYMKTYSAFETMILKGDDESALNFKNSDLRPAYENYQGIQQQILMKMTDELIRKSTQISTYSTRSGWILFFLGLAPFIYAITRLIYLIVFLKLKSTQSISLQERQKLNERT